VAASYAFYRHSDGRIYRHLVLPHRPLAVACEGYSRELDLWSLFPFVADGSFERVDREVAAAELGTDDLDAPGASTELVDIDEPPVSSARARWLIARIRETQAWALAEGARVGRALEDAEIHSPEWWRGMDRWHQLVCAYSTLYWLWDELRMIQAMEIASGARELQSAR
jgi:hypothetical protein